MINFKPYLLAAKIANEMTSNASLLVVFLVGQTDKGLPTEMPRVVDLTTVDPIIAAVAMTSKTLA